MMGELFFSRFIDLIWVLRLPLSLLLASFVFRYLGRLRDYERRQALLMFLYFFLITSTYWLIKAIKKSLLVGHYQVSGWTMGGWHFDAAQVELIAKEGNALLAVVVALAFGKLTAHIKRERLALCMIIIFALGFLLFRGMLIEPGGWAVWLFYFYGDLFITLMVATFFAFLNDSGNRRMARRLYGLIGLGGVLGGFFGSTSVAAYATRISASGASGICAGILILTACVAFWAGQRVRPVLVPVNPPANESGTETPTWRQQLGAFLQSPYLLGMACIVGLHEMASTIIEYQFTWTVLHFVPPAGIATHFSNVYAFTNFIALLVQLFLTRFVLTHIGVTQALLFLPGIALLGETGFAFLPGLLTGSLLNTCNNAVAYSLNQSAREALYVPMQQEAKYRGKAFIDIFVLRFAKAIAIAVSGVLLTTVFSGFEGVRGLSLIVLGLIAVWFLFIYRLDLYYNTMNIQPKQRFVGLRVLQGSKLWNKSV